MKKLLTIILVLASAVVLSSCRHHHEYGDWYTEVEATCIKTGTMSQKCNDCGDKITKTIDMKGHSFGSWRTEVEATCLSTGSEYRKCTVCNYKEQKTINKTSHSYSSATCENPKTCIYCGITSGIALGHSINNGKCTRCGYVEKTTFQKLVDYIKIYGDYDDGLYEYTIYSITTNGVYFEFYLRYDPSYNEITIFSWGETGSYGILACIELNSTLSGYYTWRALDTYDNYCYGQLTASTFTRNTALSHSYTTMNSSETYDTKETVVSLLCQAIKYFNSNLSSSGFTAKSLGFNSIS